MRARDLAPIPAYMDSQYARGLTVPRLARMAGLLLDPDAARAVRLLLENGLLGAGVFQVELRLH
jgi:hypothetical protein